jgi:hypothetical protein
MTRKHCPRAWEADAFADGQLAGADRASFERHVLTCSACERDVEAIARVQAILADVEVPRSTPLEHRRARIVLLDRASACSRDQKSAPPKRRPRWLALGVVSVVLVVAVPAVGRLLGVQRRAPTLAAGVTSPPVRGKDEPPRARVVQPSSPAPEEHRNDAEATTVDIVRRTIATSELASPPPAPPVAAAKPPASAGHHVRRGGPPASAPRDDAPARSGASDRFARATEAFHDGSYAAADALFASFVQDFPSDPRREDAAFLRAVAYARMGDRDGAATRARAYLDGHPHGLRRREAQQLLTP